MEFIKKIMILAAVIMWGSLCNVATCNNVNTTIINLKNPGFGAKATFTFDDTKPTKLAIELIDTSVDVPDGFDGSDQLPRPISFDLSGPSYNVSEVGPQLMVDVNTNGEWGCNEGAFGLLSNLVSTNSSQITPFGEVDLDKTVELQGGICTNPPLVPTDSLGTAAANSVAWLSR